MKKIIVAIFSLSLMIVFFNYCKRETTPPLSLAPEMREEQEIKTEEEIAGEKLMDEQKRKEMLVTQEKEKSREIIEANRQREKKLMFSLDSLGKEKNITFEYEAVESLKPLYSKYDPDALNRSFSSYIEAYLVINPKIVKITKKDIEEFEEVINKFDPVSLIKPDIREWGLLTIIASPKADSVWIRGLEGKYDKKRDVDASQWKKVLLKGVYEIIVYYTTSIKGNSDVKINSIKEDEDGETLKYSFD